MKTWQTDVDDLRKQASDKMREAADILAVASQEKAASQDESDRAIIDKKLASIYTNLLYADLAKTATEAIKSARQIPAAAPGMAHAGLVAQALLLRAV